MKTIKFIHIALLLFAGSTALSQEIKKAEIGLSSGFNSNIFKSPNAITTASGDVTENGAFTAISGELDIRKVFFSDGLNQKTGKHQIDWRNNFSIQEYTNLSDASRTVLSSSLSHYYTFQPDWRLKSRIGFSKSIVQENILNDVRTIIPFAFNRLSAETGVESKQWKNKTIGIYGDFAYKNYTEFDALDYQQLGMTIRAKQKFKSAAGETSYIRLDASIHNRQYQNAGTLGVIEDGDEIALGDPRKFNYYRAKTSFDWAVSKNVTIEPGISYLFREDNVNDRSYSQLSPSIETTFETEKTELSLDLGYATRNYTDFSPGIEADIPLQYNYLNANLQATQQLSRQFELNINAGIANRISNANRPNSRSFRDFNTSLVAVEVRYKF